MVQVIGLWVSMLIYWSFVAPVAPKNYEVEKLPSSINSDEFDETNPVLSADGSVLYFTRVGSPAFDKTLMHLDQDLSKTLNIQEYSDKLRAIYSQILGYSVSDPVHCEANQDIWIAYLQKDKTYVVEHPGYPLNSALPNSVCSISKQDDRLIIINQFDPDGGLKKGFSSIRKGAEGAWDFPEAIRITNYYSLKNEVNLHMHSSGDIMILSLAQNDALGSNDLYISQRISGQIWSAPLNLGPAVNTSFRESTPFLSKGGEYLFFASNRPGCIGGTDIWVSHRNGPEWTDWTPPFALKSPLNTESDESQPYWDEKNGQFYFSSKRDGSSDIFKAKISTPKQDAFRDLSVYCTVIDAKTREALGAQIIFSQPNAKDFVGQYYTPNGKATIRLFENGPMNIRIEKPGYSIVEKTFDPAQTIWGDSMANHLLFELMPQNQEDDIQIVEEKVLPPPPVVVASEPERFSREALQVDKAIQLQPIYFVKAKAIIQEQSYPELDRLSQTLLQNKDIHIRIDGYTDNYGDLEALMKLSYDRAAAIRQYLVRKGVETFRIQTRGRGPANPVTDNASEEAKQANRRVEVIVTKRN